MKLNCRECKVRESCIEENSQAPGVKEMLRTTFAKGRDTLDLWEELQKECLLVKQASKARRPSLLRRRLQSAEDDADPAPGAEQEPSPTFRTNGGVRQAESKPPPHREEEPAPAHKPATKPSYTQPFQPGPARTEEEREPTSIYYCLALEDGQPRIALPVNGEIVVGRFDLKTNVIPDVDLSCYDTEDHLISRRHALISGYRGQHFIEDLGSTNGTRVNGKRLIIGETMPLRLGDCITLGQNTFVYIPIPETTSRPAPPDAYLWVAFTGNRFALPPQGEVIIGRSDHSLDIAPDIDLSTEGDAALVVTRRHVKIIAQEGCHYVEDLGSRNSTKVNGQRIQDDQCGPLNPGDHLWLGGCVLVYGIEPQAETATA